MGLALVLLAAGSSRRFQGNKLLYHFSGKPMYRHLTDRLEELPASSFEQKIVVTQYEEIAEELEKRGFEAVYNYDTELGISHSIHLALPALKDSVDAVCFAVCDQPYLTGETLLAFLREWRKSGKGMGCLTHQGEFGNPAVFSMKYRDELMDLTGDVGGRRVIRKHLSDLYLYEVEDGKELVDIDIRLGGMEDETV
ncbi:NTP transferase domain-containing protein [Clostridium sp. MCC353]|uniref:nucleotidyltransferase family protein n=1 Tax=Clostridium sp. MCC353 TaxID=2592646 RepID=UPI001C02DD39|nr:nucleotidyltransferase family protein [Clostridium sp. MCC353]MBT9776474.1 NTP transferase domain-containing protein [Clostridium sp. MCC353]